MVVLSVRGRSLFPLFFLEYDNFFRSSEFWVSRENKKRGGEGPTGPPTPVVVVVVKVVEVVVIVVVVVVVVPVVVVVVLTA